LVSNREIEELEEAAHTPPSVQGAKTNDALPAGIVSWLSSHGEIFPNKVSATALAKSIAAPDPIPIITP
jgi:hypothetical protein